MRRGDGGLFGFAASCDATAKRLARQVLRCPGRTVWRNRAGGHEAFWGLQTYLPVTRVHNDRATVRARGGTKSNVQYAMSAFAPLLPVAARPLSTPQRRHELRAASSLSSRAALLPCCAARSRRPRAARRAGPLRAAADPRLRPRVRACRARVVAPRRTPDAPHPPPGSQAARRTTAPRQPSRKSCSGASLTALWRMTCWLERAARSQTRRRGGRRTLGPRPTSWPRAVR